MLAPRRLFPLALLVAALAAAPAAWADGDPASDVLLVKRVFLPYKPPTSAARASQLARATAAAEARHEPVRVALIATPTDLGAVPDFFGRPQEYARFLSQELTLGYHGGLVVVMPAGVGTAGLSAPAAASVHGLGVSSGADSDALAKAGVFAVQRITRAEGRPIPTVLAEDTSTGVDWARAVLAVVVAALLALVIAAATRRRRAQAAPAASHS